MDSPRQDNQDQDNQHQDLEELLAEVQEQIKSNKAMHYQLLGIKEGLLTSRQEIISLCKDLGIEPKKDTVTTEIEKLENTIAQELKAVSKKMKTIKESQESI